VNRKELYRRLLETFTLEMEEHLQTMAAALAQLAADGNDIATASSAEHLQLLFRAVHSLKGAARSVDLTDIEEYCHRLENMLAAARTATRGLTQDEIHSLYEGLLWLQERNLQPGLLIPSDSEHSIGNTSLPQFASSDRHVVNVAAEVDMVEISSKPALTGKGQNSVRLPAAILDRLLSLLSELQLVSHSGVQLLQYIDELNTILNEGNQANVLGPIETQPQTTQLSNVMNGHGRRVSRQSRADDQHRKQVKLLLRGLRKRMARYLLELELAIQPLDREIHISRLQTFQAACESIQTIVNAYQVEEKGRVSLILEGQDVELDRALIEGLRPVLMHLVRNALDHGIEPVQQRIKQGKPECGEIWIKAQRVKGLTSIIVQDDGSGVDEEKLVATLKDMGLLIPQERTALLNTLFEPGLSTASVVSKVSGRGVGLDAVRSAVIAMRGTITLTSIPGNGVTFHIQLPQTLSAYRVLIVEIEQCRYAIDAVQVKLTRRVKQEEVIESDQGIFIAIDGKNYPLGKLETHLVMGSLQTNYVVIVTDGRNEKALLVDQVVGLESAVVKDLETRLGKIDGVNGGAILSDGSIALMLDTAYFLKRDEAKLGTRTTIDKEADIPRKVTVLVVEDAMTTRMLEVNVLESAGYKVIACVDGQQAWEALRENPVDIVVSDVDMPRLNGFELTRKIRDSAKWSHIPVILLTARASQEDKLAGLHAGANIYMKKSHFDQVELLEAVNRLASS
jgi:two-component system, chemotaxis family, sensor kinase CheA